jgi:hypothetical protein
LAELGLRPTPDGNSASFFDHGGRANDEGGEMSSAMTLSAERGDVLVIASHRPGESTQMGEILEVLCADHAHYRVRWDDGRESIFFPGSDATIRHFDRARREDPVLEDQRRHFFERLNAGRSD